MRYSLVFLAVLFIALTAFSTYQGPKTGSFTDERDGQTYKTVEIGDQTWMAEDLRYNKVKKTMPGKYGRLYDWATVMGEKKKFNKKKFSTNLMLEHQGICPNGWRLPHYEDFEILLRNLDKTKPLGGQLKSTSSWADEGTNGTNESGFDAKAAGFFEKGSEFGIASEGRMTAYWTSSETENTKAYAFKLGKNNMVTKFKQAMNKNTAYACRCIKE